MALTIGNVDFGIDANTQGLQKALGRLKAFEAQVNKVARSQQKGAQAAANAMGKQESAIKRAFQQTINLRKELKKSGASATEIARVSTAFKKLTADLTKGRITTLEYTRALDGFNAKLGRSKRALQGLKAGEAARQGDKLTTTLRNLESASVLAVGPLSGLGARIRSLGAIMNRTTFLMAIMFGAIAGGVVALTKLTTAAVRAGAEWERSMARFLAATGSLEQASAEMLFVIKTSRELGLRITTTAKAFSRLTAAASGTRLEGIETQKIFLGVSKAAAALRLTNVEVEGTFRAIEQIMSKGTVQAEELRGQLGERLPGAFNRAAKAMGVTTQELGKLLKQGRITAEEFLPKFTAELDRAFGARAAANLQSFDGALANLFNSFFLFSKQFDEFTRASQITVGVLNSVAGALDSLRGSMDTVFKVLGAATGALAGFVAQLLILGGAGVIGGIVAFGISIAKTTKGVALFNIALNAIPFTRVATGLIKLATVVGGAALGWKAMEKVISDVDDILQKLEESAAGAGDGLGGIVTGERSADFDKFLRQLDVMQARLIQVRKGVKELREFDELFTPLERFKEALEKSNLTTKEQIQLTDQFIVLLKQLNDEERRLSDVAQRSANAVVNSLEDMIFKAESAREVFRSLAKELIRLGIRAAILDPLARGLGSIFGGLGFPTLNPAVAPLSQIPGRQAGGPVAGGRSFLVGERGPELFTPSINGNITPSNQLAGAGGGGGVNITINAPGADQGTIARIQEIIVTQLAPQIINAATRNTFTRLKRPRFA